MLHGLNEATFAACLAERPPIFSFFRGRPAEAVARAHEVGALTMHQVTTVAEAQEACAAGVDVLVAQGHEAGGHNGPLPLLSLLPAVVAVADERPVLAAGGIVNGRDLAAVLCLGAAGVLMGTRFLATPESPISPNYKAALVAACGPDATVSSEIFDILWDDPWPGVQVRALHNGFMRRWLGREEKLKAQRAEAVAAFRLAELDDNVEERGMLAGMGAGRIHDLKPAGQIVREMVAEAAQILERWGASSASVARPIPEADSNSVIAPDAHRSRPCPSPPDDGQWRAGKPAKSATKPGAQRRAWEIIGTCG